MQERASKTTSSAAAGKLLCNHRHRQQQQQQPFNGRLSGTTWVGRYQKKIFTRSHPSWSTYFLYHLSLFATVHGILFIQLTCLTVLSNEQPLSRSSLVFPLVLNRKLHTPCISSPNHHHLFAAHDRTNAACTAAISMLCLCLSSLLGSLSFSLTPHIHLTILISAR